MAVGIMINNGGAAIEVGGFSHAQIWGTGSGATTSPIIERPNGYSIRYTHGAIRDEYYGNVGVYNSTLKGSNDKSTWTTVGTGGTYTNMAGGNPTNITDNKYKYYQLFVDSSGGPRYGGCGVYLIKDGI